MLTRSRHTQAYKQLGDVHRRWTQANRLLAPAIESLPQLLIIPILLFVVGLLDDMLSRAIPLSRPFIAIFVAGILSCVFAVAAGAYVLGTVIHGCEYSESSPFQTTISRLIVMCRPVFWSYVGEALYAIKVRKFRIPLRQDLEHRTSGPFVETKNGEGIIKLDAWIEPHEHIAFHEALQQTHHDNVIDQAVTALPSLIAYRQQVKFRGDQSLDRAKIIVLETSSLFFMLSTEASVRSNLSAAHFIISQVSSGHCESPMR